MFQTEHADEFLRFFLTAKHSDVFSCSKTKDTQEIFLLQQ